MPHSHQNSNEAAWLRWLPFLAVALVSVAIAAWAPYGRKPFYFDWNLSPASLLFSINKPQHIAGCAVLAALAVLATGRGRVAAAFGLALLVGACWELAQTTVVGHNARLADLLPDALGATFGCVLGAMLLSQVSWFGRPPQGSPDSRHAHRQRR